MIQENASVAVFGKALKEFMTISWDKKKKKKKLGLYCITYHITAYSCTIVT